VKTFTSRFGGNVADATAVAAVIWLRLPCARARLGAEPLSLLFWRVAGFVAPAGAPGAWWRGLRLVSLDGTTLNAQDEQANWERFGGPSTKTADRRRLRGAFPQVRLLALAECGTRALVAAVHGTFATGEKTLARDLIGWLGEGMLCLADRNFACWELWRDAAATGTQLLWRIGASFTLLVDEILRRDVPVAAEGPPQAAQGWGC
jgi:hypothetical protein